MVSGEQDRHARSKRRSARIVWALVAIQCVMAALLPDSYSQWVFLTWTLCAAVFLSRLSRLAVPDVQGLVYLIHDSAGYTAIATGTLVFCGLLRLA